MSKQVAVSKAEDFSRIVVEVFNTRDIDALMSLYERDATLVMENGEEVRGAASIRARQLSFLGMPGEMTVEPIHCIQTGDLALLRAKWRFSGNGPDGKSVEIRGDAAEIVRRQPDGRWCYVIEAPFGAI